MPRNVTEAVDPAFVEDDELSRFYAHFANGLHALAQPLTVLRSTVATSITPGLSAADQRKYLDTSVQQIEHACHLFQCLQDLVAAVQIPAQCGPVALADLLRTVGEVQKDLLQESGIDIKVVTPENLRPALGDMERILQALFAALKIAASVSSPGDIIELLVMPRNCEIELTIQNGRTHGKYLKSSARLSLALAEANMRSQQGGFECVEDPFRVTLTLPVQDIDQDIDPAKNREIPQGSRTHRVH